jgi:DNA-binding NarL/FixJ family response regulator
VFDNDSACIPAVVGGSAVKCEAFIALIESRPFIRECLHRSMQSAFSLPVVAYSAVSDLERQLGGAAAQIVILSLMDGSRPDEGANSCKALSALLPETPIIVLAGADDMGLARTIINCGAKGYIPATMGFETAVAVVRFALAGGTYVPPEIFLKTGASGALQAPQAISSRRDMPAVGLAPARSERPETSALTKRELAVVRAVEQGKSNKIIAYHLNMCESTVKVHVRNIMKKLSAKNRTDVAMRAQSILSAVGSTVSAESALRAA